MALKETPVNHGIVVGSFYFLFLEPTTVHVCFIKDLLVSLSLFFVSFMLTAHIQISYFLQTSNALSGCEKEEIPKWVWRRYKPNTICNEKKSLLIMKGKNGILLFVEFLKGLLEDRKWR